MARDFVLPDLGEGIAEAQIVRVLVKPGDTIELDQYVLEVETDKAAVEIPSPYAGKVKAVNVKEGQVVNVGDVVITFDADGREGEPETETAKSAGRDALGQEGGVSGQLEEAQAQRPLPGGVTRSSAPAAPAVRKLAREMGIEIDSVTGTGPGGRITKEDLTRHAGAATGTVATARRTAVAPYATPPITGTAIPAGGRPAESRPAPRPTPLPQGTRDKDDWGPVVRVPLNQIRKTIANQMSRSAFTIPHVTHADEADITELDRMRRELNEATGNDPKMTPLSFLIRATCLALHKYPVFNASFDQEGSQIIYKEYINLGIAVDTERGLIVPVIRGADQLSLRGIATALRGIAEKVRANQFSIDDLRGGTFTISNVGALGGIFATAIINYPEVAVLALGRSRKVPAVAEGRLVERLFLPVCVSFDHRATDGANAARFTREIISYLETPARILLD